MKNPITKLIRYIKHKVRKYRGIERPSDLIRSVGWCQCKAGKLKPGFTVPFHVTFEGYFPTHRDAFLGLCATGAVRAANLLTYGTKFLVGDVERELVRRDLGNNAPEWNDAPGRTVDEVLDVLESIGY